MSFTLPAGYLPAMPYIVSSDARAFAKFLEEIFGASVQTFGDREDGTLLHAEARFENIVIMFCDATPEYPRFPGNTFLYVADADGIMAKAAALGLKILQELDNRDYGRGGGFQDAFGNHWWVNTPLSVLENSV